MGTAVSIICSFAFHALFRLSPHLELHSKVTICLAMGSFVPTYSTPHSRDMFVHNASSCVQETAVKASVESCCCAVLCCAVLCCAVLCCAVLCCAVLCCAALMEAPLQRIASSCGFYASLVTAMTDSAVFNRLCSLQIVPWTCSTSLSIDTTVAYDRLFEMSRHERARSHQSASSSHDSGLGGRDQSKPAWDAAVFGPSGLLPGQTHTPTRIGRDLHELVAQPDQQIHPGEGPMQNAPGRHFSGHDLQSRCDGQSSVSSLGLAELSVIPWSSLSKAAAAWIGLVFLCIAQNHKDGTFCNVFSSQISFGKILADVVLGLARQLYCVAIYVGFTTCMGR